MKMWDEAPKAELFGVQIYSFGLYCAIGLLCAAAAVCVLCRTERLKKGTGLFLSLLSAFFGMVCSRLVFCLLQNVSLGVLPLAYWPRVSAGGWSLFGMIPGAFLGAWICAKLTGERSKTLLDIVSCALPLFMASERFGERLFELFDISRPLTPGGFPENTFLAVKDRYYPEVSYLATYLLSAAACIILFLILVYFLTRSRQEGDLWILFLILCGAGGIILESLRYDYYLVFSFVRFQQVFAALILVWGIILAGRRTGRTSRGLFIAAVLSLIAAIGAVIAIEFALDRSSISHYLLYAAMLAILCVPVTLGIMMLRNSKKKKGTETL